MPQQPEAHHGTGTQNQLGYHADNIRQRSIGVIAHDGLFVADTQQYSYQHRGSESI
jgi:hypothetical protein